MTGRGGAMQLRARECQPLPEAGKRQEGLSELV